MKLILFLGVSVCFISSAVIANSACSGFKMKIKNTDDMRIVDIKLYGAEITPKTVTHNQGKGEHHFTISNTTKDTLIYGQFTLQTISLPQKAINIRYTLENKAFICEHHVLDAESAIPVNKTRSINQVAYTITPFNP